MRKVALFVEDSAHKLFLKALIKRFENEYGVELDLDWKNAWHGHPAVVRSLKKFLNELVYVPDLLVVATDANCKGPARRQEIEAIVGKSGISRSGQATIIIATPNPHIERWFLLDSKAFRTVFGRGCDAPDHKCERSRYKKLLIDAIRNATGFVPDLGGIEYSDKLVQHMDLEWLARTDDSLGRLLADLRGAFQNWRK